MRITKHKAVKEIFFSASNGRRSAANFVDGMWALERTAAMLQAKPLLELYRDWKSGLRTTLETMHVITSNLDRLGDEGRRNAATLRGIIYGVPKGARV